MKSIDIIDIDKKIQEYYKEEYDKLSEFRENLNELFITRDSLAHIPRNYLHNKIQTSIDELQKDIASVETKEKYTLYLSKTSPLIHKYQHLLNTPIRISFIKKPTNTNNENEKQEIVRTYVEIVKGISFNDVSLTDEIQNIVLTQKEKDSKSSKCSRCGSSEFEDVDKYKNCKNCGSQEEDKRFALSYRDANHVNITQKYTYDRSIHFRECMNQYQGKQNCTIDPKVYSDLEREFRNNGLLLPDNGTPFGRFSNITKSQVSKFLRDLKYTKQYENSILIHHNMTGKLPDNIRHLEDELIKEFEQLVVVYDELYGDSDRKNFISTHLILYKLLRKHRHPCRKEDFIMLKTSERKAVHNDILRILFHKVGFVFVED